MNRPHGFTLIEILIVLAVLGILAAIAIPRFSTAKEKAFVASMTADLHHAAIYEEIYAAEHGGTYFSGAATEANVVEGYRTSKDVTVTLSAMTTFTAQGGSLPTWTAVARHAGTDKRCEATSGTINCLTREDLATGQMAN
jgi:prepilin-type N-terminal cleavage/methylation domain-containing protein